MPYPPARSQRFLEGFILTMDDDGLHIEVTDYHARPLHLGWSQLHHLGLTTRGDESAPVRLIETRAPQKSEL